MELSSIKDIYWSSFDMYSTILNICNELGKKNIYGIKILKKTIKIKKPFKFIGKLQEINQY